MELKVITDETFETITVNSDRERVSITTTLKEDPHKLRDTIILNKREAIELYQYLGEWIRGEK